jgi:tetratricopeptide (TPR) repeat protein
MNRIASGLALVFLAGCASAPPPPPPPPPAAAVTKATTPEDMLEEANAAFAKRDYQAALSSYDRVLAAKPDDEVALFNKAVTLHRLGKKDEAKALYEQVIAKSENDTQATLNLGALLMEAGKYEEAEKLYNKALKSDEYNASLLNNLSVIQRKKKDYKAATKTIRKLLMRDQDNVDAYKNLALVHFDQKQYKLAQTILENALKMATEQKREDPDIYVNLGMVFLAAKENGKAMAAFKKAIGLDVNHVVANYNIGALALSHRDYNLAAKAYEVVAKAWPDRYDVHASLGYAFQGLEQYDRAADELLLAGKIKLESAVVDASDEEQLALQTIIVLQSAGKNTEALQRAEEYIRKKGLTCTETDTDGFCGRLNGIKATIQMEIDAKNQPPPEEKKEAKDADDSKIFTDQPAEGGEEPPAEGAAPPAEGETPPPPADGETPPPQ